jgi:hypothetical protein
MDSYEQLFVLRSSGAGREGANSLSKIYESEVITFRGKSLVVFKLLYVTK